jgi:hypothetical protein
MELPFGSIEPDSEQNRELDNRECNSNTKTNPLP